MELYFFADACAFCDRTFGMKVRLTRHVQVNIPSSFVTYVVHQWGKTARSNEITSKMGTSKYVFRMWGFIFDIKFDVMGLLFSMSPHSKSHNNVLVSHSITFLIWLILNALHILLPSFSPSIFRGFTKSWSLFTVPCARRRSARSRR